MCSVIALISGSNYYICVVDRSLDIKVADYRLVIKIFTIAKLIFYVVDILNITKVEIAY